MGGCNFGGYSGCTRFYAALFRRDKNVFFLKDSIDSFILLKAKDHDEMIAGNKPLIDPQMGYNMVLPGCDHPVAAAIIIPRVYLTLFSFFFKKRIIHVYQIILSSI